MNMSGAYQNPIYNQQMQQYGQQYAYNPYMNQPRIDNTQNYMQAPQQIQQQIPVQTFGINGKVVPAVENITANDVPMDGSVAFFPKQDMTEIYAKSWNADGTIRTIVFKPVSHDTVSNLSHDTEKLNAKLRWLISSEKAPIRTSKEKNAHAMTLPRKDANLSRTS